MRSAEGAGASHAPRMREVARTPQCPDLRRLGRDV